jgi:hypothetical protein
MLGEVLSDALRDDGLISSLNAVPRPDLVNRHSWRYGKYGPDVEFDDYPLTRPEDMA